VAADVESARLEWEDASARFDRALRDPGRAEALEAELEIVLRELRRRVGATFTLRELGLAYRDAEAWVREALAEHAPTAGWPLSLSIVEGAAFHVYSRGAVDYDP
jgi:alcohol dehydrogenase class IV